MILGGSHTAVRPREVVFVASSIAVLAALAYATTLTLPFISDDYVQILLGREYGPVSKWGALAGDALYRCRATSIAFTYWLERAAGVTSFYYNLASLLLHIANSLLVFALGFWRPVGWRAAALAAGFFAVCQRHSEAVVWFAAVPELLVFFFALASFLLWIRSLESRSPALLYAGSMACYLLALLSKESAVVVGPLCALAVFAHPGRPFRRLWALAPFAAIALLYFVAGYSARATHLHYNDGTFSLHAPFVETLLRSIGGLLWVWGAAALPLLFAKAARPWRMAVIVAGAWMVLTLLPYSFLTYMPRVPSRHTYLASVGLSLIVAVGLLAFREYARKWNRAWLVPAVACVIVVQQCGHLWTIKRRQYAERARPTEELISLAGKGAKEIRAKCFPYSPLVGELALQFRLSAEARPVLVLAPEAAQDPEAVDLCNKVAHGPRR